MVKQLIESYCDDRAKRYFDVFPCLEGQVTISIVEPRAVSGWHRHQHQTDEFFVAKGKLLLTVVSEEGAIEKIVLSSRDPQTYLVSPNHWHGWKSFQEEVMLIYYLSRKHDEGDEERCSTEYMLCKYGVEL